MSPGREIEVPVKELEDEIIAFLHKMANKPGGKRTKPGCNLVHGKACALGTCVDNKPRVTPEKMVLLHMRPGLFPMRKTWEPGRATIIQQGA